MRPASVATLVVFAVVVFLLGLDDWTPGGRESGTRRIYFSSACSRMGRWTNGRPDCRMAGQGWVGLGPGKICVSISEQRALQKLSPVLGGCASERASERWRKGKASIGSSERAEEQEAGGEYVRRFSKFLSKAESPKRSREGGREGGVGEEEVLPGPSQTTGRTGSQIGGDGREHVNFVHLERAMGGRAISINDSARYVSSSPTRDECTGPYPDLGSGPGPGPDPTRPDRLYRPRVEIIMSGRRSSRGPVRSGPSGCRCCDRPLELRNSSSAAAAAVSCVPDYCEGP